MSDTTYPHDWQIEAVPTTWDPDSESQEIPTVDTRYSRLPVDFYMVIRTPSMPRSTALLARFRGEPDGAHLSQIVGTDEWLPYLPEVINGFPPTEWPDQAEALIVNLLRLMEKDSPAAGAARRMAEAVIRTWPIPDAGITSGEGAAAGAGTQRRRKITNSHLQEVADIYRGALAESEPPTRAVQLHFDVSHSTAAKWVGKARDQGFLPPA